MALGGSKSEKEKRTQEGTVRECLNPCKMIEGGGPRGIGDSREGKQTEQERSSMGGGWGWGGGGFCGQRSVLERTRKSG